MDPIAPVRDRSLPSVYGEEGRRVAAVAVGGGGGDGGAGVGGVGTVAVVLVAGIAAFSLVFLLITTITTTTTATALFLKTCTRRAFHVSPDDLGASGSLSYTSFILNLFRFEL